MHACSSMRKDWHVQVQAGHGIIRLRPGLGGPGRPFAMRVVLRIMHMSFYG